MNIACSVECAQEIAKVVQAAKKRRELRERKQKLKTLEEWIDDAQKVINKLVVLEDKPKGCISCETGEVTDAGHYFHRGSKYRTAWLTLSRINLNGQCRKCNSYTGGGNQHEYRKGYIARYGEAQFEELEELKRQTDSGEVPAPTVEDVKIFIAIAKSAIKRLKEDAG